MFRSGFVLAAAAVRSATRGRVPPDWLPARNPRRAHGGRAATALSALRGLPIAIAVGYAAWSVRAGA